jgi:hypothetical protein
MPNPFGKPRAGDELEIPASVWGELLDIVQWFRGRHSEVGSGSGAPWDEPCFVDFVADSNLSFGQPVWLAAPHEAISPAPSGGDFDYATRRFLSRPVLTGLATATATHTVDGTPVAKQIGLVAAKRGRATGAAADKLGSAVVSGLAFAWMTGEGEGQAITPAIGGCQYAASGFATVVYPVADSARPSEPHLALVRFTSPSQVGAQLKFARSTGANQEQQSIANNLIGTVEALPVDAPGGTPAEGAQPIVLAVIGQRGQTWGDALELRRFHLPASAQIAYVESTACSGAVGVVVHDYDDDLSYELYWGQVRGVDNQGTMEPELRDSGHFGMPKQVRVDVLNTATGGVATGSPTAWILLPEAATRALKVGDKIVFRQEFALRAGDVDPIVSSINWGEATWADGRFVAINVGPIDDDCGQFGCGVAVGVDVPRTESTGILRMFRGKRPDLTKPMSTTNRAPYELQLGMNKLGRWLSSQSEAKVARITLPGLPYGNFREPSTGYPWWTKTDGTQMPNIFRTVYTGRHLVSRKLTDLKNGVELDWSPPGYSGGLYVMSAGNNTDYGNGAMTNGNFNILYLVVRDGLILGGVPTFGGTIGSGIYNFNRDTGADSINSLSDPDDAITALDTGCCPKYDAASDVTQGP